MIALIRLRDALGRERWEEREIDTNSLAHVYAGPVFEDDIEEARRRR
jgi:hypothetical protein